MPTISILIPCYNSAKWIAKTLESALAQNCDKEIIVVDDGSTDNSIEIIQRYPVKLIEQENQGASVARNRAFQESAGEFIQYLDADDLLAPDKIKIQLARITENTVTSSEWGRFYDHPCGVIKPQPIWSDRDPVDWICTSWTGKGGGIMPTLAWLTPRRLIEKAGPWNPERCSNDDGEFFTRVVLKSKGVKFCQTQAYYRIVAGSYGQRQDLEAVFRSIVLCANHLLYVEDSKRTRLACADLFQKFVYIAWPDPLAKIAEIGVKQFGGSSAPPFTSGTLHQLLTKVNWKLAKRVQLAYRRI